MFSSVAEGQLSSDYSKAIYRSTVDHGLRVKLRQWWREGTVYKSGQTSENSF